MKPIHGTAILLRLSYCADLAMYALHLACRKYDVMLKSERIAEATQWQRERLFWSRTYRRLMTELLA